MRKLFFALKYTLTVLVILFPFWVKGDEPLIFSKIDVKCLAFSSNGRWLAAGGCKPPKSRKHEEIAKMNMGTGGLIKVWDVKTGKLQLQKGHDEWEVTSLSLDKNSTLLAVGFQPKWRTVVQTVNQHLKVPVIIWDVRTGKEVRRFLHTQNRPLLNNIRKVAFVPDGSMLVTATWGLITVWDIKSGKQRLATRNIRHGWIDDLAISPNGKLICCVSSHTYDSTGKPLPKHTVIEMWNLGEDQLIKRKSISIPNRRFRLAFSGDSKCLAAACWKDGRMRIYDVINRRLVRSFKAHDKEMLMGVAFSSRGKRLITAGGDGPKASSWKIWDGAKSTLIRSEKCPFMSCVAISPDGHTVATGTGIVDCNVRVWRIGEK